ncbi:hypothetical protein ZYGR_0P01490 [Zygosaccharomyces rouxii]|uniref:ZYRO0E03784p n=2 Tax=Zygosaccharomyces rouxii TaxID=4956 RepID=C5E486_ZYGRC|nr:uncharacterized protein ZYRO0E03784g [Zygosaccharomyces rouxii]GAV49505.1 hypothetical protein ZYGR_0P01490 [Zygosaccharomyces rouxii]CAQ43471.1 High temperature lethal protein 1 [Zygosaccharomyces rouxii]CAR30847.1 ZYRO0E03784p [Zygosaccharomyces rouxii]
MSSASNSQRKYNNITLKTLTAYQLMSQRERMCELFQLLDDSERHEHIVNPLKQENICNSMKENLRDIKNELGTN